MLAARGVSLGLGKINLADLNQFPSERAHIARLRQSTTITDKPKIIIRKKADAKTVWAACRAVIFGCVVISIGLAMAILGYFDKHLSMEEVVVGNSSKVIVTHNRIVQYHLKSMQYIGPILMGIGTFVLIIACVITLESRDKHAQIITEESADARNRRVKEEEEKRRLSAIPSVSLVDTTTDKSDTAVPTVPNATATRTRNGGGRVLRLVEEIAEEDEDGEDGRKSGRSNRPVIKQVHAEVHRAPRHLLSSGDRYAPLADLESLLDASISESSNTSEVVSPAP